MVDANKERFNGSTGAEEEASDAAKNLDKAIEVEPLRPLNLTRGFQRMRADLSAKEKDVLDRTRHSMEQRLREEFAQAFAIMNEIHIIVREPEVDGHGEVLFDEYNFPLWKKHPEGSYVEDWSRLTQSQIKHFIFMIINSEFADEQKAADAWGKAMLAKVRYEEAFAVDFDGHEDPKATVDSRRARAESGAIDHKYFAVLQTWYSKKADGIIRSMDRIHQRLKDSLAQ